MFFSCSNLELIGGRTLTDYFSSLYIVKTSLRSLNLRSLKMIRSGSVAILENKDLCFADGVNWAKVMPPKVNGTLIHNNKQSQECRTYFPLFHFALALRVISPFNVVAFCLEASNLLCDKQCSKEGCWGTGANECLSCQNYKLEDICVENCDSSLG